MEHRDSLCAHWSILSLIYLLQHVCKDFPMWPCTIPFRIPRGMITLHPSSAGHQQSTDRISGGGVDSWGCKLTDGRGIEIGRGSCGGRPRPLLEPFSFEVSLDGRYRIKWLMGFLTSIPSLSYQKPSRIAATTTSFLSNLVEAQRSATILCSSK